MYNFYYDAGHGWLEVSISELINLDIYNKITSFSYMHEGKAYLEEDCDLEIFCEAYRNVNGKLPKVVEVDDGSESPIRCYSRFCVVFNVVRIVW